MAPKTEVKKDDIVDSVVDLGDKEEVKDIGELEVDLEPKKEVAKEEPRYVTAEQFDKLQKQFNGVSKTLRHVEGVPSQIAELQKVINSRFATSAKKEEAKDELDDLLEKGDWRTPVNRLAEQKFNELMVERERQTQVQQEKNQKLSILLNNQKIVRDKYPDIDDSDSEIARKFQKVINEKPEYLNNEFGPTLAMRDMEDELRLEGRLDEFSKKAVEKEVARQTRVGATGVPKNAISGNGNKIMLTKEQREFCDSVGMKYEHYGKFAKQGSPKEGVEA